MSPLRMPPPAAQRPRRAVQVASWLLAATAGWLAHGAVAPAAEPAASADAMPAPARQAAASPSASPATTLVPVDTQPLIALASDGNVTLRVEQQPLDWVLEQIAAQGGWPDLAQRHCRTVETLAAAASPQPDAARVLQQIETGTEQARFDALMQARTQGIAVAEPLLRQLYESGASERVQRAAFEAYLALRADQPEALRTALEAAQYAPTAHIRQEAAERLTHWLEAQRLAALPPLTDP